MYFLKQVLKLLHLGVGLQICRCLSSLTRVQNKLCVVSFQHEEHNCVIMALVLWRTVQKSFSAGDFSCILTLS